MIKKIISTTVSSILVAGSLAGCSAKDCNPSNPRGGAFFGAIGCSLTGGYDARQAVIKQRVKISEENLQVSQNRYYKVLLTYQKFMADITNDNSKLERIEQSMAEVDREAQEIAFLHDEIVQEEEQYLGTKVKKSLIKKRIQTKKKAFAKKLKSYSQKKEKLTKELIVDEKQQKIAKAKKDLFEKKKSDGLISKKESVQLQKVTSMLGSFKKNNSDALNETKRSTMMVKSLVSNSNRRMSESSSQVKSILGASSKDMLPSGLPENSSKALM